jgi:predicted esterase
MTKKRKVILIVGIAIIMMIGVSLLYMMSYEQPMVAALAALKSDSSISVMTGETIVFTPQDMQAKTALIIYPGAKVPPEAYAPMGRAFAERGIKTIIVRMPFNLALFGVNKADKIIEQNGDIEKWYIAGHSLGGAMAAKYVKDHQAAMDGLILWAAYPGKSTDLSQATLPVMSIYGTKDGLIQPGDISKTRHLLPESVQWVSIQGANHSQFGWYGFQKGDEVADMTREEQQHEIVEATMELIKTVN